MGHGNSAELHLEKFVPSKQLKTTAVVLIAIGLLGLGYGLLKNQDGLWPAYLTAFFYVACLPFKRVQVVDFYSESVELRPWNFWTGRGRTVLQRIDYADILAVETVAGQRNTLGLRFSQDRVLWLRDKPHLREFLNQKLSL